MKLLLGLIKNSIDCG